MATEYSGSGIAREKVELGGGKTLYVRRLDGLATGVDVMKFVLARGQTDLGESSLDIDNRGWSGTRTMEEAIQQAEFGWAEGREQMDAVVKRLNIDELLGQRRQLEPRFDVAGDEADVSRFLAGEPDDMVSYDLGLSAKGKVADLWINCSNSWDISAERIMRRGAAIAAAHTAVTAAGYSLGVEMVESCGFNRNYNLMEYHVPVVRAGDYFDQDVLTWCMASPAFLRRLNFALNEIETNGIRRDYGATSGGGYGSARKLQSELPDHTILIDQGEGLDLRDDDDTTRFAQGVVDRALKMLENREDDASSVD